MSTTKSTVVVAPELSRLEERRVRDPHYLSTYWKEHKKNFSEFFTNLLESSTIIKLANNAKDLCLQYNLQTRTVPPDYNQKVIAPAYDIIVRHLSQPGSKAVVLSVMDEYFSIIDSFRNETGNIENLRKYFSDAGSLKRMEQFSQLVLSPSASSGSNNSNSNSNSNSSNYDKEGAGMFFYPQLLMFFARFFDIYDGAIKGNPIAVAMKNVEQQQQSEHIQNAQVNSSRLKEMWQKAASSAPSGPAAPFQYDGPEPSFQKLSDIASGNVEEDEGSNPVLEEQISNLSEAYESALLDHKALYNYKKSEFTERWNSLDESDKKKWVNLVRENIRHRAKIGMMYCPELNSDDLSKSEGKSTMLAVMEDCLKMTTDISILDSFVSSTAMQMKAKGIYNKRTLLIIIYTRRWVLCTFCVNMIMELLQLGQEPENSNSKQTSSKGNNNSEDSGDADNSGAGVVISDVVAASLEKLSMSTALPERDRTNPLERPLEDTTTTTASTTTTTAATKGSSSSKQASSSSDRKCSNPNCPVRESHKPDGRKFLVCGGCKKQGEVVPYCSSECQLKHWRAGHKEKCKQKTT